MRQQLEAIFYNENALYMTGDAWDGHNMIGLWKEKPKFDNEQANFHFSNATKWNDADEVQDIPWCIDLCSGVMELPTLNMTLPLEEWALM